MALFPERIETERLELTPLTLDAVDVREFFAVCSHHEDGIGEVTAYLSWTPHETPKETRDFLQAMGEKRANADGAEYLVSPREGEDGAGEIAGATGLSVDWARRRATLGLWLRERFWGRGYSGERAAALLEVAFDHLELDVVAVTHAAENDKSRRAIEKYVERFGGRCEGTVRNELVDGEGGRHDALRYSVAREEYANAVGEE